MNEGIYLGPPRPRRLLGRWVFAAAALATLYSTSLLYRALREVEALEAELGGRQATEDAPSPDRLAGDEAVSTMLQLRAVVDSGALATIAPSDVFGLVASALPDEMTLVSLSAVASTPRPNLLLEAIAARPEDVSSLQRGVASSPLVSGTRLLEERRLAEGGLAVRLQVDLAAPATR